jgi:hypothetical protein
MKNSKYLAIFTLAILNALFGQANSAQVHVEFTGKIENISPDYAGSLILTDILSGSINYDDSSITGSGDEFVDLGTDEDFTLTFSIGNSSSYTFTKFDDTLYGSEYPSVDYSDGKFQGLNFLTIDKENSNYEFEVSYSSFRIYIPSDEQTNEVLSGTIQSYNVTSVPLSGSFTFFMLGGFVLMLVSFKKLKSSEKLDSYYRSLMA